MLGLLSLVLFAVATPAAAQQQAPAPELKPATEKKICKKTVDTGSFIKGKKICLTRAEWNRVAEEQSNLARRVVNEGTGRPAGN